MAAHTVSQRHHQTTTMVPEHFMGKAVLKMSLDDLQQFVQSQLAENPALTMEDERRCPVCGCELNGSVCAACGSRLLTVENSPSDGYDDWHEDGWSAPVSTDDTVLEPLAMVASPSSLFEHLRGQIRSSFRAEMIDIAEHIIDALDEDGYLREPMVDIAGRIGLSVPQLETVLTAVQSLDPPGIGARDLRECLLLQIVQIDDASVERCVAEIILREHWDGVCRMRLDRIADRMELPREMVESALRFIRERLNPHPASMFRDPWERLAPRAVSRTSPDVAVRQTDDGLIAEILDPTYGRISVETIYAELYEEMSSRKSGYSESDCAHVKENVRSAWALIEALEFRRTTLQKVTEELMRTQADFFTKGPRALKPMTRKELAARIGVHESTVCRATQDKSIQLPSGEVVSLEVLFDSALPVKEMVRELAVQRLSDGEIAARLTEAGIQIARRTVAKYRDQLKVLPVEYRLAS